MIAYCYFHDGILWVLKLPEFGNMNIFYTEKMIGYCCFLDRILSLKID